MFIRTGIGIVCAVAMLCLQGCSDSTARGSLGDSCTRTADCRGGLRCTAGTCTMPKVGDPCLDDKDCGQLKCDKKTNTCVGVPVDAGALDLPVTDQSSKDLPPITKDTGVQPDLPPTPADLGNTNTCPSWAHGYVFNKVMVPTDSTSSQMYALEHNGKLYNSLGGILALLSSQAPSLNLATVFDEAVCSGKALHLLCLRAKSLASDPAASGIMWPASAACCTSSTCVSGGGCNATANSNCFSGANTLYPVTGAKGAVSQGAVSAGQMKLGPGNAVLFFSMTGAPVAMNLKGAQLEGQLSGGKIVSGKLAGGVDQVQLQQTIVPAIAASVNATYTDPTTDAQTKALLKTLFDTNGDGKITASEVSNNGLIKTFLAGDVDVDNDGQKEVSVGVGFTAVGAKIK